jgi:hypothetical protein
MPTENFAHFWFAGRPVGRLAPTEKNLYRPARRLAARRVGVEIHDEMRRMLQKLSYGSLNTDVIVSVNMESSNEGPPPSAHNLIDFSKLLHSWKAQNRM